MAKLEIPSIVVHNGSTNQPLAMERSARTKRTLSKQAEFDEDDEIKPTLSVKKEEETEIVNDNSASIPALHSPNTPALHRSRSQSKVKLLVRSHAVREETSPPPDPPLSPTSTSTSISSANINNNNINNNNNNISGNCLSVTVTQHKLKRDGSSQGSLDSNWSACLSRGSSIDQYTDSTGVDLEQFIADTLNRNQKDKVLLLKIEHELISLVKDSKRSVHKFPSMSSYQRMLVHRVAAYFGMDHNVDPSGHQVVVNKTKSTRLPESKFSDLISSIYRDDLLFPEEPRRSILKRDSSSFDETSFKSPDRQLSSECRRSKSFEEREEEYEKARRRIFNRELGRNQDYSQNSSQDNDDIRWPGEVQPWTSSDSHQERKSRMLKVESYESKDTLRANSLRLSISKSFSFGGYDQSPVNTRILTKQDSGSSMSSRLSPSSSGYKSQSQRSDITLSATPSPSATPHLTTQLSSQSRVPSPEPEPEAEHEQMPTVMWAVTSIDVVPPGSILINPQTGQPYTNLDGSIYHFDPENPPKVGSEEEGSRLDPLDPSSAKLTVPLHNQSDSVVKKKQSPKLSNATAQTSVSSCTETSHSSVSVVFCNKSSHSLTSQDTSQVLTKNQSNIPQLVKNQQQPNQSMVQPQVSTPAYVQYPVTHPSQSCYPHQPSYQPVYPSMGSCNIVLQPPGPPPEGIYSASPQQPLVYTPSQVPVPAPYEQRVIMPGQNQSLPFFYVPPNTSLASNHTVTPRYPSTLNNYTPLPSVMSMERTGGGYLTPAGEWNGPTYPQSVHMYYNTQCNNNGHNNISNYCNNTNSGPSGVLIQFPPPSHPVQPLSQSGITPQQSHLYNNKMTASPSNQQPQYTMYGMGAMQCYPLHYTHTSPPHPSNMMRPPNIQTSPPLMAYGTSFGRSRSPAIRERSTVVCPGTLNLNLPENSIHSSSPIRFANVPTHTHMPFYVTRLLPHAGDVQLMGSNNPNQSQLSHRIGFPLPTNINSTPPSHMHKTRMYARAII